MMLDKKVTEFLDVLSSSAPVPGGGGASAAVGAFASALGMMVANLTIGKKKYQDVEEEIRYINEELLKLQKELVQLTDQDAEAFAPLAKAYSLPKETEEQKKVKSEVMEKALVDASMVPLEIMEKILEVMKHLKTLGEKGSRLAVSDVGVAILFARAALEGASLNIYINTKSLKNEDKAKELNEKADALIKKSYDLYKQIYDGVLEQIR